ncbi:MAG: hypothetical protein IKN73_01240 [Alphaproteobacteria bacterium]|nr:hypothetical protein [Alphaproteobacteria bacterium]
MQDDEKMFNLGIAMFIGVIGLIMFLQVCYREQNRNLKYIHNTMETVRQDTETAETRFSALNSGDLLRGSVVGNNPKAETVSYSKTIHIDEIPMVEQ